MSKLFNFLSQGGTLHHDVGSGIIISNQSLVVQRVTRADSGRYTCHVFNTEGEGVSEAVRLSVKCRNLDFVCDYVKLKIV